MRIVLALALATVVLNAQAKIPRTSWGTPDLQGIWNTNTFLPLERPSKYATRATMTEAEHARSGRIAAALSNARVAERRPLDRMAALIAGASFVIGVDTGLIHLAAALGVPLVAIFVASEPGLTGPMGAGPIVVVGGKRQQPSVSDVLGAFEQLA